MTRLGGKIKEELRKRRWNIHVKTWMLVLLVAILLPIDATLLRWDHIRMVELRDAVLEIDARIAENGDNEEVEAVSENLKAALIELKEFTFSNIVINVIEENGLQKVTFGTGPFYLEHSYLRDATVALKKAEQEMPSDENPNGNIYARAGEICQAEAIKNGWSWNSPGYINCMLSEIEKYPEAEDLRDTIVASLPSTELYRHNYASPVWAPTVTGWAIAITIVVIVVIFIRFIVWLVLRLSLLFV